MTREAVAAVQRHALERALLDADDARRYFALAGALDAVRPDADDGGLAGPRGPAGGPFDPTDSSLDTADAGQVAASADAATGVEAVDGDPVVDADGDPAVDADGVLPAALLSLAVVRGLDAARSTSPPAAPWLPGRDPTGPAVRRGARLALRWFDVSTERVATRAGLPEATLAPDE